MTKTRGVIYGALVVVLISVAWVVLQKADKRIDTQIKEATLAPGETLKVIVSPNKHSLTTVTKKGIETSFLPDSGASVSGDVFGNLRVVSRKWGTTVNPLLGLSFGSDVVGRAAVGLNLFYIQRWELGGGLLLNSNVKDTRAFVAVTYNAYDNIVVGLGIDNRSTAQLLAGLKF